MNKTFYEKTLNYNFITKYLHGNKTKSLIKFLKKYFDNNSDNKVFKILDIGCGPSSIFKDIFTINKNIKYTGIDIRKDFIDISNQRYSSFNQFEAIKIDAEEYLRKNKDFDLIISFDSFEHIPLDKRNNLINLINHINFKFMFINVPNEIGPAILIKNFGSFLMGYVRYKEYSLTETFNAFFYRLHKIKSHYDGHKGFDWRVLHYTLRYYFKVKVITSPFLFIPKSFSPSIFFICENHLIKNLNNDLKSNAIFISNKLNLKYDQCLQALKENNNNINLALNFLKTKDD